MILDVFKIINILNKLKLKIIQYLKTYKVYKIIEIIIFLQNIYLNIHLIKNFANIYYLSFRFRIPSMNKKIKIFLLTHINLNNRT